MAAKFERVQEGPVSAANDDANEDGEEGVARLLVLVIILFFGTDFSLQKKASLVCCCSSSCVLFFSYLRISPLPLEKKVPVVIFFSPLCVICGTEMASVEKKSEPVPSSSQSLQGALTLVPNRSQKKTDLLSEEEEGGETQHRVRLLSSSSPQRSSQKKDG